MPTTDEKWREILEGSWIKDEKYQDKQSFLTQEDLKILRGNYSETDKIKILREKCDRALEKKFYRSNFPATRDFLGGNKPVDEFQEAALFCSSPITAGYYVTKAATKGGSRREITQEMKQDYCHIQDKDIEYYKNIKTTDPMEGKTF